MSAYGSYVQGPESPGGGRAWDFVYGTRPEAQVPRDLLHYGKLVDQGHHAHDLLAHRAAERVSVPDFLNEVMVPDGSLEQRLECSNSLIALARSRLKSAKRTLHVLTMAFGLPRGSLIV